MYVAERFPQLNDRLTKLYALVYEYDPSHVLLKLHNF